MRDVVITSYLRTAQSRSKPSDPATDAFQQFRPDELLAKLLGAVVRQSGIHPTEVDDFLMGSALGVGEQWTFGGRNPLFLANFPESVPAKFVDQQCGSSMAALHVGYLEIGSGTADCVLVGGTEHMSRVPMDLLKGDTPAISWSESLFQEKEYHHWDMRTAINLGMTAEKLTALDGFTREDLDAWARRSHLRAAKAQDDGYFAEEILPIQALQADGTLRVIDRDLSVRPTTTMESLAGLRPAFKPDGVITAGNASPLNAGASSMVLMAREAAERRGLKPLAQIRSIGFAGVEPSLMGTGPVPASRKALEHAGLSPEDVDFWEINEAFCVVVLHAIKELGLDPEAVNVRGGGIALGHALGSTGIRLVGTLARILQQEGGRFGCATACTGGGQGVATIIERV